MMLNQAKNCNAHVCRLTVCAQKLDRFTYLVSFISHKQIVCWIIDAKNLY